MKTRNAYSMKQSLLYTICVAAWNLCSEHVAKFSSFKAFYTPAFITAQLKALDDAKDMPDILITKNTRSDARVDLTIGTKLVLKNWQALKAYVGNAFPAEKISMMLVAAGSAYYAKSGNDSWDSTRHIIDAANNFIAQYTDILSAGGTNMPENFPAKFKSDGEACADLATAFAKADMEKELAVSNRIKALNSCYDVAVRMLLDGVQIFREDEGIKKQFSVSYLKKVNGGEKSASLSGYVYNENNLPIEGAVVASKNGVYNATTDKKGKFKITRVASDAGLYTFTIICPGYQPVTQDIDFKASTGSRADFTLALVMKKVA